MSSAGPPTANSRSRFWTPFVNAGFNTVDMADACSCWVPGHSGSESETVIGEWIAAKGQRDRIIIATKVGAGLA